MAICNYALFANIIDNFIILYAFNANNFIITEIIKAKRA